MTCLNIFKDFVKVCTYVLENASKSIFQCFISDPFALSSSWNFKSDRTHSILLHTVVLFAGFRTIEILVSPIIFWFESAREIIQLLGTTFFFSVKKIQKHSLCKNSSSKVFQKMTNTKKNWGYYFQNVFFNTCDYVEKFELDLSFALTFM